MGETDDEGDYGKLITAQNRKQKKAGGWQALGLDHTVFKGIERKGYRQPTPIQRKAIPPIIDGKDVVAMSRTGSGKTAAFIIPMLQKLKRRETLGMRALLIAPTRELAMQTFKVVKEIGRFTGLRCAVLVGGDSIENQFAIIHEKPDVLIATPGRLLHLVVEMNLNLSTIQYLVLDEADRLFEMGFSDQLNEVFKKLPDSRQTLLFSATLPKMLVDFAKAGLSDPMLVRLDVDEKISDKLSMIFLTCRPRDKTAALLSLVRSTIAADEQTIVFCATMKHVEYVSALFCKAGIDCVSLYSQLDAVARKMNIQKFRNKECSVLVVTDVAARGVDLPLLDNAVNFHFPPKAKLFVHRVGRVARAGRSGKSFSLITPDELPYLADLFLFLGRPLKFAKPDSVYKEDDPLIGSFPDELIDLETDFLKNIHEESDELVDLLQKSENAMSKYSRTRTQPSAESVRRTKSVLRQATNEAAAHPILQANESKDEVTRASLLSELRNFKPSATIFEVQSGSKALPAAVMKNKRKAHQRYVKDRTTQGETSEEVSNSPVITNANEPDMAEAFNKVIGSTKFAVSVTTADGKKSRKRKAEELEREKREHFIAYKPTDADAERALAVDRGFDATAKAHIVDISADDDKGLYLQEKRKKWDRKLKRYVGEAGDDPAKKKIRTEDGTLLPASFKSGRYEYWQKKQQVAYQEARSDESGEEDEGDKRQQNKFGRGGLRGRGGRGRNRGLPMGGRGGRGPASELKSREQILKARKKKLSVQDYQAHRRQENMKKKIAGKTSGFGGARRGRGRGR